MDMLYKDVSCRQKLNIKQQLRQSTKSTYHKEADYSSREVTSAEIKFWTNINYGLKPLYEYPFECVLCIHNNIDLYDVYL